VSWRGTGARARINTDVRRQPSDRVTYDWNESYRLPFLGRYRGR